MDRLVSNRDAKYFQRGRILRQGHSSTGYKIVSLSVNGRQKMFKVHRLVAIAFIDNPCCKAEVNHIDGNPANNNIDNLEWVTHSENMQHAYATGLVKSPNINNLTIGEHILKQMYIEKGMSISEMSSELNISRDIVRNLLKSGDLYLKGKSGVKKKYMLSHEWVMEQLKTKTSREIAREIGCSEATISKYKNNKNEEIKG